MRYLPVLFLLSIIFSTSPLHAIKKPINDGMFLEKSDEPPAQQPTAAEKRAKAAWTTEADRQADSKRRSSVTDSAEEPREGQASDALHGAAIRESKPMAMM